MLQKNEKFTIYASFDDTNPTCLFNRKDESFKLHANDYVTIKGIKENIHFRIKTQARDGKIYKINNTYISQFTKKKSPHMCTGPDGKSYFDHKSYEKRNQ